MKLETLARRIAEKSGEPLMEKLILGQIPVEDLPSECITWTGTIQGPKKGRRHRLVRTGTSFLHPALVFERPYAVIKYQGKRHQVHRLLFQLIQQPDYEFRMYRNCPGEHVCINPTHWASMRVKEPGEDQLPDVEPEPDFLLGSDWTAEEVEELLEFVFEQRVPKSFEEILADPMMLDAPPDLVRLVLKNMNKDHLL